MAVIYLRIEGDGYKYAKYCVTDDFTVEYDNLSEPQEFDTSIDQISKPSRIRIIFTVDGIFLHYLLKELIYCPNYRRSFVNYYVPNSFRTNRILFKLCNTTRQIIDYNWNGRISHLVWERCELENALSWLSTLGGAFSALGDYFGNCALVAGKISYHQLGLAIRMGDPTIAARCKLYFSLSLIQRRKFKLARRIIRWEYKETTKGVIVDTRLVKMCLGIWSKLQYEHRKYHETRKAKRLPSCR